MKIIFYLSLFFFITKLSLAQKCVCVHKSDEYRCTMHDKFGFIDRTWRQKFHMYNIDLTQVGKLIIKDCPLVEIEHFHYQERTQIISIQNVENITGIEYANSFRKVGKLDFINCNIRVMPVIKNLTYMWRLDMSHNKIGELVHDHYFPPGIEYIFLQNNNISSIAENTFSNLRNLKYINLQANRLYDISLEFNIESLKTFEISLSNNPLLAYFRKLTINSRHKIMIYVDAYRTVLKNLPYFNITHVNAAYEIKPLLRIHKKCDYGKNCEFDSEFYLHCYIEF